MKRIFLVITLLISGFLASRLIDLIRSPKSVVDVTHQSLLPIIETMSYSVSINSCPPSEKFTEEDIWISTIELAERRAENILNKDREFADFIRLLVIPRMDGYEVRVFSGKPSDGRREEIGRVVDAEILRAQRERTRSVLKILQKDKHDASEPQKP
jgi:hypothetical protein